MDVMKSKIETMQPADFEQFKTGLRQQWTEVVKDLRKERSRYWAHIDSGYLDFLRRASHQFSFASRFRLTWILCLGFNDSDLLTEISKDEVLELFLSRVHPSGVKRSKLSVQLQSRKPRPPRISATAATAFEALVGAANIFVDGAGWKEDLTDENPLASEFVKHWQDALSSIDDQEKLTLMKRIPELMVLYPVDDEVRDVEMAGVTFVEDVKDFKASLEVTELPKPLVEWGDLPLA
jgi:insulysin